MRWQSISPALIGGQMEAFLSSFLSFFLSLLFSEKISPEDDCSIAGSYSHFYTLAHASLVSASLDIRERFILVQRE